VPIVICRFYCRHFSRRPLPASPQLRQAGLGLVPAASAAVRPTRALRPARAGHRGAAGHAQAPESARGRGAVAEVADAVVAFV
jgi:hypothetical protein